MQANISFGLFRLSSVPFVCVCLHLGERTHGSWWLKLSSARDTHPFVVRTHDMQNEAIHTWTTKVFAGSTMCQLIVWNWRCVRELYGINETTVSHHRMYRIQLNGKEQRLELNTKNIFDHLLANGVGRSRRQR